MLRTIKVTYKDGKEETISDIIYWRLEKGFLKMETTSDRKIYIARVAIKRFTVT